MIDAGYAEKESGNERGSGEVYHFIFKQGPPQIFTAYFTLNDNNAHVFFIIDTLPTNKNMVEMIKTLRGKKFDQFWISAP
jgi:hypothetical protein